MLQILGMVERRLGELDRPGPGDPSWIHLVTEAMEHAYADRAAWLADPQYAEVPVDRLLSAPYLDRRAAAISLARTSPAAHYGSAPPPGDGGGTSHVSVVDAAGMGVACTETINLQYGSLVVVPGFGFALNDEMDDFTTSPGANHFGLTQSARNAPEPGKRPLSSMSPTIVLEGGRPVLVAGASGGPLIISATVECLLSCLVFDMTAGEAVRAPRFHHQWLPDELEFETRWDDELAIASMREMGHATSRSTRYASVQLIRIGPDGIRAASDPRKGGAPAGY